MESIYGENLKQALLKLQDSLNELITNTYLTGFQDGQELGLKASGEDPDTLGQGKFSDFVSGLNPDKSKALQEAEKILKDYS